ncbi:phage tail assembly chaperone [Brevundimonas faecalis]|uniref:phage tail assembly chaperone n=1 Tax=Brevundimonas faecalis TaxID=947378 RepID=UPI00361C85E3
MSAGGEEIWGEMLRAAARAGVTPEVFWRLSLREWRMLTAAPAQARPMGRAELERMAELWPD